MAKLKPAIAALSLAIAAGFLVHAYGDRSTANQGVWLGLDVETTTGLGQYSLVLEYRGDPGILWCDHFDRCILVLGMSHF